MQGKKSNAISFRRLSSGGSIGSTQSEYFNRRAAKNDFERIFQQWSTALEPGGYILSNTVVTEFKKRISQAGKLGEKAKLNLAYAALDDKRLVLLIEALAQKPVIAKLDLRGNDLTDESVKVIVKLLKGQLRLVKEIEKDKRLSVAFLGEILLENNSKELDGKLLRKITHMCDALRIVNAHAFIRTKFLESHAPEVILSPFLIKMWFDVVGKLDHDRISKAFVKANISERSTLGYEELEKILTQGLILRGSLPDVNEDTLQTLKAEKIRNKSDRQSAEEDDDVLLREIQSIPAANRSLSDDIVDLQPFELVNIVNAIEGKDDSSSVTEREANSTENYQRKDSKESIKTDEDVHPYNESTDSIHSPTTTSIPFFGSGSNINVKADSNNAQLAPSPEKSEPVPERKIHLDTTPSVTTEKKQTEDLVRTSSVPKLIDQFNRNNLSDFTIPRIASVSRITTVDSVETEMQTNGNALVPEAPQRKLSDLFDEATEEDTHAQKDQPHTPTGNPLKEATTTPKPAINVPSKFISVPRKGSNLYEDTVLELSNKNLALVRFSEFLSTNRYRALRVLILRNNRISNLSALQLFQYFPNVTDLDLAHNDLRSRILDIDLPRRIQRLDLSHNNLTDISGLMACVELKELNISHNNVKALYGLPTKLTRLDISNNRIHTVSSLRSLSICVGLTSISVQGNPVIQQLPNVKVFLRSVMPNLQEIDGVRVGSGVVVEKRKLSSETLTSPTNNKTIPAPVSPKPSVEEQKIQDSVRATQLLAKQKLIAASKSVIDEFISESQKSKKLKPDEVDSLTKRLYAPRGSPNDPRKYVNRTFQPSKKARRHSDDGKGALDSIAIIDEWLSKASQQFDRIVKAFKVSKSFIRLERVKEKEHDQFTAILNEIKTNRLVDVNVKLKGCLDQKYKDHDKLNDIPKIQSDIEKSIVILQQIQTIILFCIEGAVNFSEGMDLIMGSKAGQYVNENVLRLYNCYYDVNYSYQDFITRQVSSRSISNEGFTYDVRDEFLADNPMVLPESRKRSSVITILGNQNQKSSATHDPLDRVRTRVVNKFLPPEIKLDVSLDNHELLFAESNPMARLKKTPVKSSLLTDDIVKEAIEDANHAIQIPVSAEKAPESHLKVDDANENSHPSPAVAESVADIQSDEITKVKSERVIEVLPETEEVKSPGTSSSKSPIKSPKSNTNSPLLKSNEKSFRRSIEKVTKKISTKDVQEQSSPKKDTTENLSAKERLRRRVSANKPKESEASISSNTLSESNEKLLENSIEPTPVESSVVTEPVATDSKIDGQRLASPKPALVVQTEQVTIVTSPQISPKKSSRPTTPTSRPSPGKSPLKSSSQDSAEVKTLKSPKSASQDSAEIKTLKSPAKSASQDSNEHENSQNRSLSSSGPQDISKLNAKERLRLRMEKNKKQ